MSREHPGLREAWQTKLKTEGLALANRVNSADVDMTGMAYLLSYTKIKSLDALIEVLKHFSKYRPLIETELQKDEPDGVMPYLKQLVDKISKERQLLTGWFQTLKRAGFDKDWQQNIKPTLEKQAMEMKQSLQPYPLQAIYQAVSSFLHCDRRPAGNNVYLTIYSKPVCFMLPRGGMVIQGDLNIERFLTVSIHESLHVFPGTTEVQQKLTEIYNTSPGFKRQYDEQITQYQEGPEEYFVVAAECYLAESLGMENHGQCVQYINEYDGGMPLSLEIYEALRTEKPDLQKDWRGFGPWLVKKMDEKAFQTFYK